MTSPEEVLLTAVLQNQRAMLSALAALVHVNGQHDMANELVNLSQGVKEMLEHIKARD